MRKPFILAALFLALFLPLNGQELVKTCHPRLIMDDDSFDRVRENVLKGENEALVLMHQACMHLADTEGLSEDPVMNTKDASNKRILHQSRKALLRIFTDAYAYRFTGDEKYLHHAESDILQVCSFPDWNPSHFLDVGEMAAAVAFGYDWLYDQLKPETRETVIKTLRTHAFEAANNTRHAWFYTRGNNWNQVCNGGLVCAALATFEDNAALSRRIINDAVRTNALSMFESYAPDGNYAEGPSYWEYGTSFQVLLLTALESCLGHDYGISGYEGFDKTGDYVFYSLGPSRKYFNFYDNSEPGSPRGPMWYFASKFDKPWLLRNEMELLRSGKYANTDLGRLIPMYIYYADKVDVSSINPDKLPCIYSGKGKTPVVLVHTDPVNLSDDVFLGIKGGRAMNNHAHMDAGSFVFDCDGLRWAMDLGAEGYAAMEVAFNKCYGGGFWNMTQKSPRWKTFRYHNRQHNTLTVNDRDHRVDGLGSLVELIDEVGSKGGTIDLGPVFRGDLASATRKAVIRDNSYLEITDALSAPEGKPASVRWTMVTPAEVNLTEEGIILRQGNKEMQLKASGADVRYKQWSSDPKDYGSPVSASEKKNEGCSICGFEFEIPASGAVTVVTTLKKH